MKSSTYMLLFHTQNFSLSNNWNVEYTIRVVEGKGWIHLNSATYHNITIPSIHVISKYTVRKIIWYTYIWYYIGHKETVKRVNDTSQSWKSKRQMRTVKDQSPAFHQLFRWPSVGPSKYPIDKMIGSQGHLAIGAILWIPCVLAENSFTENFLQINKFSN